MAPLYKILPVHGPDLHLHLRLRLHSRNLRPCHDLCPLMHRVSNTSPIIIIDSFSLVAGFHLIQFAGYDFIRLTLSKLI